MLASQKASLLTLLTLAVFFATAAADPKYNGTYEYNCTNALANLKSVYRIQNCNDTFKFSSFNACAIDPFLVDQIHYITGLQQDRLNMYGETDPQTRRLAQKDDSSDFTLSPPTDSVDDEESTDTTSTSPNPSSFMQKKFRTQYSVFNCSQLSAVNVSMWMNVLYYDCVTLAHLYYNNLTRISWQNYFVNNPDYYWYTYGAPRSNYTQFYTFIFPNTCGNFNTSCNDNSTYRSSYLYAVWNWYDDPSNYMNEAWGSDYNWPYDCTPL